MTNPLRWTDPARDARFAGLDAAIAATDGPPRSPRPPAPPAEPMTYLGDVLALWELRPCFDCGSRKACEHRELDMALAEVQGLKLRALWRDSVKRMLGRA